MAANIHRPVSNRGQWRDSFIVIAYNGPVDPTSAVFSIEIRRVDGGCCTGGSWDYGRSRSGSHDRPADLSASTDDETGRFATSFVNGNLACTWLFPTGDMRRLGRGSYEASLYATIADERGEIERLSFVVS